MTAAVAAGWTVLAAVGALVVVATLVDLFLTIFDYDGFTFVATAFQRLLWRLLRAASRLLPARVRHDALSIGSAAMVPATVALWLGLEITGFALMFAPGLVGGGFRLTRASGSLGTGFYLSAGAISSLSFGDVTPTGGLDRALVDLETIVGLATFTLALGYLVTTFGVLGRLEDLHGLVTRHAEDPERPSSILARHFRGGEPSDLPSYLQQLSEALEAYDQGLRRYPVVYFFHTRRMRRSIPHVFAALGDLLELLRFGLPAGEPMADDPFLAALLDGYETTLDRLRLSFVGPEQIVLPQPLPASAFAAAHATDGAGDDSVAAFCALRRRARASTGTSAAGEDAEAAYARYQDWLPFRHRRRVVLGRVADRLGYELPESLFPSGGGSAPAPARARDGGR